jgi:hypothetical protein
MRAGQCFAKFLNRSVFAESAEGAPWHVIPSLGKLHEKDLCVT